MLRSEVRRTGQTFKKVLNDSLRSGFQLLAEKRSIPFEVATKDMGKLKGDLSLDCIADLLERAEGPWHR
jgi:hypothetical protein